MMKKVFPCVLFILISSLVSLEHSWAHHRYCEDSLTYSSESDSDYYSSLLNFRPTPEQILVLNRIRTALRLQKTISASDFPLFIGRMLKKMHQLSLTSKTLEGKREVGALVLNLKNGSIKYSIFTSNLAHSISGHQAESVFMRMLKNVDRRQIRMIQIFHTHPGSGNMSNMLSLSDIEFCESLKTRIKILEKLDVPVQMIAAPSQLKDEGTLYSYIKE